MPDIVTASKRSWMMSGIRGKNTQPEYLIRRLLHRRGFRFRLHSAVLPGKPDIVLPRYRAVVQVNGCFWHGHDCTLFRWPGTREAWWRSKIERTRANDERNTAELLKLGWRVATVWECAMKGKTSIGPEEISDQLEIWLRESDEPRLIIRGKTNEAGNAG